VHACVRGGGGGGFLPCVLMTRWTCLLKLFRPKDASRWLLIILSLLTVLHRKTQLLASIEIFEDQFLNESNI
jgi:hypothetical protein